MYQNFRTFIFLISLVVITSGCEENAVSGHKKKISIVATTNIIADCVKQIVGTSADVVSIMGPGVDPHMYKASQGDVELLLKADIIVYNGLHLEGKMSDVLKNISTRRKTINLSDGLTLSDIRSISAKADVHDPHYWFDMMIWKKGLQHFVKKSSHYYPGLKDTLVARSFDYYIQMDDLNEMVINVVQSIPESQRILITSHDAFGYYGTAYGLKVRGLQGISTLSEAGLKDMTELVNFISSNNVKAVFNESSVSKKALMSVVDGCRQKGHQVIVGGELFSDALDIPGKPGGSYLGMIEQNTRTIVNALK